MGCEAVTVILSRSSPPPRMPGCGTGCSNRTAQRSRRGSPRGLYLLICEVGLMKEGRLWVVFLHTRYFLWFIAWTTSSSPLPLLPPWEGGNFISLAYVRSCTPMLAPPYTPSKHHCVPDLALGAHSLVWKLASKQVIAPITTLGSGKCYTGEARGP